MQEQEKILSSAINPYKDAADFLENSINSVLVEKKSCIIGLPGGRSVGKICEHLVKRKIDWRRCEFFMVDERVVSITSETSNFFISQIYLFDPLLKKKKITTSQVHPFLFNSSLSDFGAEDYGKEVLLAGGFDIILLSAGEDGHIAALFPNHVSIESDFPGFIPVYDSPKLPSQRVTATKKLLLHAKFCCLLFIGPSKKEAHELFLTSENYLHVPAVLMKQCPNLKVISNFD